MKKWLIVVLAAFLCFGFVACDDNAEINDVTIHFVVDGTIYETIHANNNEVISLPQNPVKEGYQFDGWYWDEGNWEKPFTANSLCDASLSDDMSVYAKWVEIVDNAEHTHDEVVDEAVAPTCATTGLTEGKHCSVCSEVLLEQTTIAALGHEIVTDRAVLPSCTSAGLTEGSHCSRCNTVLVAQNEVPMTNHTESDWIEDKGSMHTECTICGKIMSNQVLAADSVGLSYRVNSDNVSCTITGIGSCTDSNIVIPKSIDGYQVTAIGSSAFCDNQSIINVVIPNSVIIIEHGAFMDCMSLESITFSNGLTTIGSYAFQCCESLKNITVPASLKEIGLGAFGYCISIENFNVAKNNPSYTDVNGVLYTKDKKTLVQYPLGNGKAKVTIPNHVTCIGYTSFCGSESIVEIIIPASVTSIERAAFHRCTKLKTVTIGSIDDNNATPVCEIADDAFFDCDALVTVTIGNSVKSIGNSFGNCGALTAVTIGASVENLASEAFKDCVSLVNINISANNQCYKTIDGNVYSKNGQTLIIYAPGKKDTSFVIPEHVTSIGDYAFVHSQLLENIFIPDSVKVIGEGAFVGCGALKSIILPEGINSIGDYTFSSCTSLESVSLPSELKSIGRSAFNFCESLKTVIIPSGVSTIGKEAFNGCKNLTIYCRSSAKGIGWDASWNNTGRTVIWDYKGN